jgi:hypothetical protein
LETRKGCYGLMSVGKQCYMYVATVLFFIRNSHIYVPTVATALHSKPKRAVL